MTHDYVRKPRMIAESFEDFLNLLQKCRELKR
jgi:hypothetical protein